MRPQEVTIAQLLKMLGYATGHFDKWHLGAQNTHPVRMGFDISYLSLTYFDPEETKAAAALVLNHEVASAEMKATVKKMLAEIEKTPGDR